MIFKLRVLIFLDKRVFLVMFFVFSNFILWLFNVIFCLLMFCVVFVKFEVIVIFFLVRWLNNEFFFILGWFKIVMVFKVLWFVFILFVVLF